MSTIDGVLRADARHNHGYPTVDPLKHSGRPHRIAAKLMADRNG